MCGARQSGSLVLEDIGTLAIESKQNEFPTKKKKLFERNERIIHASATDEIKKRKLMSRKENE